jgi:hypothetical protein
MFVIFLNAILWSVYGYFALNDLFVQKNGYENDDMMGRRIRESYVVLIDNGSGGVRRGKSG